jgi:hypothetical protein
LPVLAGVLAAVVLVAAAVGVLTRALTRPSGPVAWGVAWLIAGAAVLAGVTGLRQLLPPTVGTWPTVCVVLAPAAAVLGDWWTRSQRRMTQQLAAGGQLTPERARVLTERIPPPDQVVKHLPVLSVVLGVITGHYAGWAVGRPLAPEAITDFGAEFGALAGRLAGALVGGCLAVSLLRLYRVEAGSPWPGQGDRRYPRALAALYLMATAVLAVIWIR